VWSIQKGHEQAPDTDCGFIHYAASTLINHVKICSWQSTENRARARHERPTSPKKASSSSAVSRSIQLPWPISVYPNTSQRGSPAYLQMPPPSTVPSRSHSPALSTSSLPALPSPYTHLLPIDQSPLLGPDYPTGHNTPRSRSQSVLVDDPGIWPVEVQRKFEERIARLTVSAGLPLSWVDNPEWIDFVTDFLPSARSPSWKVLTNRLIPTAAKRCQEITKLTAKGQNTTLQADGWTGSNFHHLLAFMITFNKQVRSGPPPRGC